MEAAFGHGAAGQIREGPLQGRASHNRDRPTTGAVQHSHTLLYFQSIANMPARKPWAHKLLTKDLTQARQGDGRMDVPQLTDIDFEAAMNLQQLQALDDNERFNFSRRVMLLALGKNKEELIATIEAIGAEPYSAWLDHIEALQRELKYLQELSETARSRLLVAGQVVAGRDALR